MAKWDEMKVEFPMLAKADLLGMPPGWKALVEDLCRELALTPGGDVIVVLQVKEKFAGLRFYARSITPDQNLLIDAAEVIADHTCQECSAELAKKWVYKTMWWYTICEKCRLKKDVSNWKPLKVRTIVHPFGDFVE